MSELLNKIHNCDNAEILAQLPDNSIDAIITDPPYELGFMGNKWDKSAIAYDVELWREHLRVLKPSGYLLAFSSSRTYHRMAVAIEDAGFEIRDQIQWLYGSGFPKSKSHLKPAHEPICVARKAGKLSPLNIDDCRINNGSLPRTKTFGDRPSTLNTYGDYEKRVDDWKPKNGGRVPSNVILDETTAEILDEQSGISDFSSKRGVKKQIKPPGQNGIYGNFKGEGITTPDYNNIGGASRFFYVAKACPSERNGVTHPTVKPIKLISQLVKLYTNENDIVFDGFSGSGTTAIVCAQLNRRFILCEQNKEYFEEANLRIENERRIQTN